MGVSELLRLAGARVMDDARATYERQGPFTTVSLDVGRATEAAQREIELRWRAALDELRVCGAPTAHLEDLEQRSGDVTHLPGEVRRTVVVAQEGVVLDVDHQVRAPSPPLTGTGPLPTLVPLLRGAASWIPYVVVEAGVTAAALHLRVSGRPGEWVEEVVGAEEHARKVHAGGWSESRWQGHVEEVWRGNTSLVADEAITLVRLTQVELVLVAGDVRVRSQLAQTLRDQVSADVVEVEAHTRPPGADDEMLSDELDEALERRRRLRLDGALTRVREAGGASGAVGMDAVLPCLGDGQVETLLLRPAALEQEVLVPLGEAPWLGPPGGRRSLGIAPAAEVMARAALLTDAEVLVVDEDLPELAQGVAAALRWDRPPARG